MRSRRSTLLLVAATPRSGSNYLCELMASTGVLGVPREYFNAAGRRKYDDPRYPTSVRAQLRQVRTTGRTPNGISAVKAHPFQLTGDLLERLGSRHDLRGVRIVRQDTLGQAISWVRAFATNAFRAGDEALGEPDFDRAAINSTLVEIAQANQWWEQRLGAARWPSLQVDYEDLLDDPNSQIAAICQLAGVPVVLPDPGQVTIRQQRDGITDEWRNRYLAGRNR